MRDVVSGRRSPRLQPASRKICVAVGCQLICVSPHPRSLSNWRHWRHTARSTTTDGAHGLPRWPSFSRRGEWFTFAYGILCSHAIHGLTSSHRNGLRSTKAKEGTKEAGKVSVRKTGPSSWRCSGRCRGHRRRGYPGRCGGHWCGHCRSSISGDGRHNRSSHSHGRNRFDGGNGRD